MNRLLVSGLLVALAGMPAPPAQAGDVPSRPCPQPIIDWLQDPALGGQPAGTGEGANDCATWLHGFGNGIDPASSVLILRLSPTPGGADCGPETRFLTQGQIRFIEPVDAVCHTDTAPNGTCPVYVEGNAFGPPELSSFGFAPFRLDAGFLAFSPGVHQRYEGMLGVRVDIDGLPGGPTRMHWNADPSDDYTSSVCSPSGGEPCVVNGDCSTFGDVCVPDATQLNFFPARFNQHGDPGNPDPDLRTGDALCCTSIDGTICNALGQAEYPALSVPVPLFPDTRVDPPDYIFAGNRGSSFTHDSSFTPAGQIYGVCLNNRDIPCDLVGNDPCPGLSDVCDLRELGYRISDDDVNLAVPGVPDGSPNAARCNHIVGIAHGQPVDLGTGRSSLCAHPAFYGVGQSGDPLAGCLVLNFGSYTRPDWDCDGFEDTGGVDLCPAFSELDPFSDTNGDFIGDDCQCGDTRGGGEDNNGRIQAADAFNQAACVVNPGGCVEDISLTDTDFAFGNCSVSIGIECSGDAGCPTGETCELFPGALQIQSADAFNTATVVQNVNPTSSLACARNPPVAGPIARDPVERRPRPERARPAGRGRVSRR